VIAHPIESPDHAILAGYVFGLAMRHGLVLVPDVDEAGNYLASAVIELPGTRPGVTVRLVVDPPEVAP
jgi:hypothetical protein